MSFEDDLLDQSVTEAVESAILSFKNNELEEWELHLIMRRAELLESKIKQWVGLTTKQLEQIEEKSYVLQTGVNDYEFDFIHFAKAIETKLKELNT